jgi:(1->4)-alpha-D-glucan 1-alpha-D-glucosylmutase
MNKGLREGKAHTSWVNPDQGYEEAMRQFVESILDRTRPNAFLDEFLPFQQRVAQWGMWNALSQVVLKTTAPGIPDFYQGSELWDFSLVDPDNRRPVDYGLRASLLNELQRMLAECGSDLRPLVRTLLAERIDGRIKLYTTMRALNVRRENRALFQQGEYIPLDGCGTKQEHCFACARLHREQAVVTVVPRLVVALTGDATTPPLGMAVWEDTYVAVPSWRPASPYRNLFTGERLSTQTVGDRQMLPMADVLCEFPVALLERLT